MGNINLKRITKFLESKFDGLKVISIKKDENYENAFDLKFTYDGSIGNRLIYGIEDLLKKGLSKATSHLEVKTETEDNQEIGIIEFQFNKKIRIVESVYENGVFSKKFEQFINQKWTNSAEWGFIEKLLPYKKKIIADPEKGKQFLQDLYTENQKLIDDNCSKEFTDELNKLINEYKIEDNDQLNELEDHTKTFNKDTKKLYSDADYFSESNKNKKMNKEKKIDNIVLIKKLDEFFYINESTEVLKHWEKYKKDLMKNCKNWNEYSKQNKSNFKEAIQTAAGLINLFNLNKRANLYINQLSNIKENYLYRPTDDYCYKVDMKVNPYADKEGSIYFDDENNAKNYANNSKGKFDYIGKTTIKESVKKTDLALLKEKLEVFNWYYGFQSKTLQEAQIYVQREQEIKKLIEKCGKAGKQLYEYMAPWNKHKVALKEMECDKSGKRDEPYEDWKQMTDEDNKEAINEEMTTADMAVPELPITQKTQPTTLTEVEFDQSTAPNNANNLSNTYKGFDTEEKKKNYDPYKNIANKVKGSKTVIKSSYKCLTEKYSIKRYDLESKGSDKCAVLVENDFRKQTTIKFNKKDFAKFIFENFNIGKHFIKEGKFDYYSYLKSRTFGFTHFMINEYFINKTKNIL